jgi:hypothetical protein
MGKYEPLGQFLKSQTRDFLPMTFREIESILSAKLPPSKKYPAWWSNNPSNNVMTRYWLDAGYETESVDVGAGKLVFRRKSQIYKTKDETARKSIMGLMKGMVTLPPDFNPEEPFWELHKEWEDFEIGGLEEKK